MAERKPVTEFGRRVWTALHQDSLAAPSPWAWSAIGLLGRFTVDELDLVGEMVRRLEEHRGEYGGLDVATDARDFREEAFREGVDMMDYLLMDWLQRQVGRLKGDADGAAQGVLRFPQSQPLVLHVVDHIEDLEIPEVGE